jgi:hypothetical protein
MVQQMLLSEQHDEVRWRFTESGKYSSKSAYSIQFAGSFTDHYWVLVWKAKVEEKCKFFCWLILQNRLWIVDMILKNGGQTNPICSLC